jgi:hypothetical protein
VKTKKLKKLRKGEKKMSSLNIRLDDELKGLLELIPAEFNKSKILRNILKKGLLDFLESKGIYIK